MATAGELRQLKKLEKKLMELRIIAEQLAHLNHGFLTVLWGIDKALNPVANAIALAETVKQSNQSKE